MRELTLVHTDEIEDLPNVHNNFLAQGPLLDIEFDYAIEMDWLLLLGLMSELVDVLLDVRNAGHKSLLNVTDGLWLDGCFRGALHRFAQ